VRRSLAAVAALTLGFQAALHSAQDRKPLPSFQVVAGSGTIVDSRSFSSADRLLFIYVTVDCPSCDRLIKALEGWSSPQLIARTVILVGAGRESAQSYIERTLPASVKDIRWYADPGGAAAGALQATSAPALAGVRAGQLEWAIAGVLNDPSMVESVVRAWVGSGP